MANKKKILAVTLGGNEYPSANFRLRQYYSLFRNENYSITEFNSKVISHPPLPKIIGIRGILRRLGYQKILRKYYLAIFNRMLNKADIVWINKLLRDKELIKLIENSGKKMVVDYDDAEWLSSNDLFISTLSNADAVIAGNNYLADYAKENFSMKTVIVPTTIDLSKYPKKKKNARSKFVIGWIGSHFTNDYLLLIRDPINQFLKNTESEFHIISSNFEHLKKYFPQKTVFIEWNERKYINQLSHFNVGIMPLPDNDEWVKGKCSFKMLQYMGAGIPVIVSPFGMNAEILTKTDCGIPVSTSDEWSTAFYTYYHDESLQFKHGSNGRSLVESEFDTVLNFEKIKCLFDSLT